MVIKTLRCEVLEENCILNEIRHQKYRAYCRRSNINLHEFIGSTQALIINFISVIIFNDGQKTFANDLFRYL